MDSTTTPESILGSVCQALITTVYQVSTDVTNFVRRCRSARMDLAPVTRELSELQMVLQLLNDFGAPAPEILQVHLRPIIANCTGMVSKIHGVLQRQEVAGWSVEAKDEVGELAKSLSVHRGVMGVVADLISLLVSHGGAEGSGPDDDEHAQVVTLLEELQALGSSIVISYSNATLAREHFALQVHLGQIVTYTETLAQKDPWQDAMRTLDEAQRMARLDDHPPYDARGSIVLPAPLERGYSADGDVAATEWRNSGLENFLPLGPAKIYDWKSSSSIFFTPKRVSDPKPPAEIESAGPLGTGFIVMDDFTSSAHGSAATSPMALYSDGVQQTSSNHLSVPGKTPRSSRGDCEHRNSAELSARRSAAQRLQPTPHAVRESASGLQVQIPDGKELAEDEVVSDEALAFAQVPIHVLDRLSLNLVGHVYGGSAEDNTSASTAGASQDQDARHRENVHLQVSQIDGSKVPAREGRPASHVNLNLQPPSSTQIPPKYQQQQHELLPASHPLSQVSADPTSKAALQTTNEPIAIASSIPSFMSPHSSPHLRPPSNNGSSTSASHVGLREMTSSSTIKTSNTQSYMSQKPLPRAPLVYLPDYPGPFIKKKVVVVGNFSCGKTCLITRMARGQYPRSKADELRITETVKLSVDEAPIQLCFWDIRGIDYDPSWLYGAHVALVCFSVNIGSTDSKGKHLGRWVAEVNRNCPGAAILLVGLKSDIRFHAKSVEKLSRRGKALVTPEQGEQFRENIGATRYVECSARTGEGVHDVLAETARVAMQVGGAGGRHVRKCSSDGGLWRRRRRPLSRIGKFFGFGLGER